MTLQEISILVSISAATLAVASFCRTVWVTWRDRPRLVIYVSKVRVQNRPDGKTFNQVQFKISNIGFRLLILTKFAALGDNSSYQMGIHDEPAAAYGVEDQKFPSVLRPGETLTIHPLGVEALERNMTDPGDSKVAFNPWKYFVLVDSFGRFHHIDVKDVLWELRLTKARVPLSRWQKFIEGFRRRAFLSRAKKQLLQ